MFVEALSVKNKSAAPSPPGVHAVSVDIAAAARARGLTLQNGASEAQRPRLFARVSGERI